jgi:nucleotide-binding universal stress UspA family protein
MYDRILVPLDGSEASEAALAFVERLPSQHLRLLRVEPNQTMPISPFMTGIYLDWDIPTPEQTRAEIESVAQRLRKQGRTVEVEVRTGNAAEEIIAAAADVDLIVMTTHGRGAAGRVIFGSTADRVTRHGTTPTLLIRSGYEPVELVPSRRVVVPLDGSALAERAIPEAERLARALSIPIHLVRAIGSEEVMATIRAEVAMVDPASVDQVKAYERARLEPERRAGEYLAGKAVALREAGLATEIEVLKGTPAFVLLWAIQPDDVVVMTTHGHGGYRRWMIGNVAEKLVREAAAPVLLMRDATSADRPLARETQSSV